MNCFLKLRVPWQNQSHAIQDKGEYHICNIALDSEHFLLSLLYDHDSRILEVPGCGKRFS